MLRSLAVVGLVLGAAVPAGPAEGSVEAFIKDVMPASGVPGLAYAVVADGEITSGEGHGVLDQLEIIIQADAQDIAHVQVPGLAKDGQRFRTRLQ